ncbi:tyrosine-type recombinase/integrase [Pseudaminobacter sp. NGMCC 1.201702]|uniref:tyrosine-type recombinase/integrase n=1 Tax=Pseudaminobacter sp. NGMCC 1.201702 TaxID=3391825 RepID=UPI0039F06E4D
MTRYSVVDRRAKRSAANTIAKEAKSIGLAREWADARRIDLDARLDSVELFTHEESLDLVNWLQVGRATDKARRERKVVNADTTYSRVRHVCLYFGWRSEIAIHRISIASGRYQVASAKLEDWKRMIGELARPGGSGKPKKGLVPELRARFLEVIDPKFAENPFEICHRDRNYALLLAYYELGLRRAEGLVLKGADLFLAGSKPRLYVYGRPDDPEDPRPDQPSVKTANRELAVGPTLLAALNTWLGARNDKARYPGAKKTPFVFVSENGRPMANRTVYDLFVLIRESFPEFPRDFSPHTLRHDWNDRFSELCDEERAAEQPRHNSSDTRLTEAREMDLRNYLMGWKKKSQRSATYTVRSTERQAQEISLRLQGKSVHG